MDNDSRLIQKFRTSITDWPAPLSTQSAQCKQSNDAGRIESANKCCLRPATAATAEQSGPAALRPQQYHGRHNAAAGLPGSGNWSGGGTTRCATRRGALLRSSRKVSSSESGTVASGVVPQQVGRYRRARASEGSERTATRRHARFCTLLLQSLSLSHTHTLCLNLTRRPEIARPARSPPQRNIVPTSASHRAHAHVAAAG